MKFVQKLKNRKEIREFVNIYDKVINFPSVEDDMETQLSVLNKIFDLLESVNHQNKSILEMNSWNEGQLGLTLPMLALVRVVNFVDGVRFSKNINKSEIQLYALKELDNTLSSIIEANFNHSQIKDAKNRTLGDYAVRYGLCKTLVSYLRAMDYAGCINDQKFANMANSLRNKTMVNGVAYDDLNQETELPITNKDVYDIWFSEYQKRKNESIELFEK